MDRLKAKPELMKETAFIITLDEGGGYYDSGYIQPLDFFGDGADSPDRGLTLHQRRPHQPRLRRPRFDPEVY
jgi:phospholipase C